MPRPIDDEPDALDVDAIELMASGAAYRLVAARLRDAREQSMRALIAAKTWEEAIRHQATIQALGAALDAPAQLIREIRERSKR